jgi:hypothetical protein
MAKTKRILNCEPSQGTEDDWQIDHAAAVGLLAAAALPDTCDLRKGEAWWAIGDQGKTGSCVGWATGDSVLRWHFVKAERLPKTTLLSVRYLWMAAKETDEFTTRPSGFIEADGTSLKAALDIARKYGAVIEDLLAFGNKPLYQGSGQTFYAEASKLRIASYFNLGRNLSNWREWLVNNGPVLTRLDVDDTWMNATEINGKLETYLPATKIGGHAVALVGYRPNEFIVRNSWGTAWGDKGFAYASSGYAQAAFTEAYGVVL